MKTRALHLFTTARAAFVVLCLAVMGLPRIVAQNTVPEGALGGLFSVAEDRQVYFSQGNLQYQASTNTWRFAENQLFFVGTMTPDPDGIMGGSVSGSDNNCISATYDGWIDLFGWGTSGYNHGADCYQPWSTDESYDCYYAYGNNAYNLFDQTGQADWGYNAISNGGNQENSGWRTPSHEEWLYLFETRSTTSGIRYANSCVNNVNGVILLPDDWNTDYYMLNNTNTTFVDFISNIISASDWATLEQHGAVFLPAAGFRSGTSVIGAGSCGLYWSASFQHHDDIWGVYFSDACIYPESDQYRYEGNSVRLVCSAETTSYEINAMSNPAEGGSVSGAGNYSEGTDCTLTATANDGYTFVNWTENGEVVSTDATYTFTVTQNRILTANFQYNDLEGNDNGLFSVSEGQQVRFSPGNLQYIGSAETPYWKFADHQWDYLGDNGQGSDSQTADRDLFGWGTSGYNHGANCYQPWSTNTNSANYYAYGSSSYNLFDQTGQADWGYNAICNGGNTENSGWRTLTSEEWIYLFNTRNATSGIRYAKATVNGANGMILLPDDWNESYYSLVDFNTFDANYSTNVITASQWATLEQHGAVFLPAAGDRLQGTSVSNVSSDGYYWSASHYNSYANSIQFNNWYLNPQVMFNRNLGFSVRLVRSAETTSCEINVTPNPAEGGTVSGAGTYEEGAECTLTATANNGYTFVNWTENGEVVSTDAEYTFTVTGNRSLVANFTETEMGPEQSLALSQGWNWVSYYLETSDEMFSSLKNAIAATNSTALIKDAATSIMLQGGSWTENPNDPLSLNNETMYMINLESPVSLTLTAPLTKASLHPVTLYPGWNWIGYPSADTIPVEKALSSITPNEGDMIKNQSQSSQYSGTGWLGAVKEMVPGEGYMYYNTGEESQTLVYPEPHPMVEGTVEIPEGMDASDIIITNFSEEVVPDENGEFEIGYNDLLMAINPEYDKPVYFNLVSLASDEQRRSTKASNVEMSAKETALFLALRVFPNGMETTTDEWLNALKNILYPLDCVQQLEEAVQQSVSQYGYLNDTVINDAIEPVRAFFFETLVAPMIESFANNRTIFNPPVADPNHFGQVAMLDVLSSGYDRAHDVWNIYAMCWNAMGIGVGVVPALEMLPYQLDINPETIRPTGYIPPTLLLNMFSPSEVFSYEHFVNLFNDVGNLFHGNLDAFSTTGVSHERVEFDLTRNQNVIAFLGPENELVEALNFVTLAMESAKFLMGNLIDENNSTWLNVFGASAIFIEDESFSGMIKVFNQTHDRELAKTIIRETIHKLGTYWLDNGIIGLEEFESYNKYTAMLSAFAFGLDLFTAFVEHSLYQPFFLRVGGEHAGPTVGYIGFDDVSATSANVYGVVCNEGENPVVERGFEWICTNPSGEMMGGDVVVGAGTGVFTYHFDDLYPNTYYSGMVWARQESGGKKYYADGVFEFTTLQDAGNGEGIAVVTYPVDEEEVTGITAILSGFSDGGPWHEVVLRGFCYGTNPDVDLDTPEVVTVNAPDGGDGYFSCSVNGLLRGTTYYFKAYVVTEDDHIYYGEEQSFTTLGESTGNIDGYLNGVFTVNADGGQAIFSRGNLQYQASSDTWHFADHQWDFVGSQSPAFGDPGGTVGGSDNGNASQAYSGWIDLFGWGTSGYHHGAVCYQPWSMENDNSNYYAYGVSTCDLGDQSGKADWGFNYINNGGSSEGLWHTLTNAEWIYLLNTRKTESGLRYTMACVNGVNGAILLPDNWNVSNFPLNNNGNYEGNTISAQQWSICEQHGAVFLPAAGWRLNDNRIGALGADGHYWTSTHLGDADAEDVLLKSEGINTTSLYTKERSVSRSVRLVRYGFTVGVTTFPKQGGTVSGDGFYVKDTECTLTAVANEGYVFTGWTEFGELLSTEATYSIAVTRKRNIVANFAVASGGSVCPSEGMLSGVFSVNHDGEQVRFSQGNLQFQASTDTWRFATYQWDHVGTMTPDYNGNVGGTVSGSDNNDISPTYDGWIDLFGWGTSGYSHGANCYQPWSNNTSGVSYTDYLAYNNIDLNLYDHLGQADWGYNAISNGGNEINCGWHTLSIEEWEYLLDTRQTPSGTRFAKGNVNGVNGVLLLPDDWNANVYLLNEVNNYNTNFSSNSISAMQWEALEAAGAVFLPAAGERYSSTGRVGYAAEYWSSSRYCFNVWDSDVAEASGIAFYDNNYTNQCVGNLPRQMGCSVRLVCSANEQAVVGVSVTTLPVEGASVTTTSAVLRGFADAVPGHEVVSCGFCFSNTPNVSLYTPGAVMVEAVFGDTGFSSTVSGLVPGTTCFFRAFIRTEEAVVFYGEEKAFMTLIDGGADGSSIGALNGLFTVNESGDKCVFSRGNLQYRAATDTWRFAENQWDYVGENNRRISSTYAGWIDLFGWGTSGYDHGAVCYQPWSASQSASDYYAYGGEAYNLFDQTGQADWGGNAISNGGNAENSGWRTLTRNEWNYLFNTRNTPSGIRFAKANVGGVNGVVLLPDNWSSTCYNLNNTNIVDAYYNTNLITAVQWISLEQYGAVFLPAAGVRSGAFVNDTGGNGYYWSSSSKSSNVASSVVIYNHNLNTDCSDRSKCDGLSVRLVRPTEGASYLIQVSVDPSGGGVVTGAGSYLTGQTCTLAATANAGFVFSHWMENGVTVSVESEYTFEVTTNRNLVACFVESGNPNDGPTMEGALNGSFTVSANGDQVCFSQGNLQYIGSAGDGNATNTGAYWKFAEHQWDYLGYNGQGNSSITVDRDLFGWATSGYNHGAPCYQPWSTSTSNWDYFAYAYGANYNLYDQTGMADWGYNVISNGGNTENSGWRTLTKNEWNYVFFKRSTTSGIRYAKANVNGVNGVILLPDDWNSSFYSLNNTNSAGANFTTNTITSIQWSTLEQHGAVFLPAAGKRDGTSVSNAGSCGFYWSASADLNAYYVFFNDTDLNIDSAARTFGLSVRLVRPAQ